MKAPERNKKPYCTILAGLAVGVASGLTEQFPARRFVLARQITTRLDDLEIIELIKGWRRLALLGTILITIGACAGLGEVVQEPRLHFQKVTPTAFSLGGARFNFDFEVTNPNPLGLHLSQVTYRLALNQRPLINGEVDKGIALPARGSAPLSIPLNLAFKDLAAAVGDIGNTPKLPYQLSGKVFIGPLAIPYTVKGDLELPRLPKIDLAGVKIRELSLSGARLACQVRVTNRNTIPLDLGPLAYQLQLGEIPVASGETGPLAPLEASGSTTLTLDSRIRFREVGRGLAKLLQGDGTTAYTLKGGFRQPKPDGGDFLIPFSFSGRTPLTR
jgi:LEA14-like dessication related protein